MPKKRLPKPQAAETKQPSLRADTVALTEKAAFDMLALAQELTFKHDAMHGVLQLGHYAMEEAEGFAKACIDEGYDKAMTTAAICGHLAGTYYPNVVDAYRAHEMLDAQKKQRVTSKPTSFDRAIAKLQAIKPDPAYERLFAAKGGNVTLADVHANTEIPEYKKEFLFNLLGARYEKQAPATANK